MSNYSYDIKIDKDCCKSGYIRGEIENYAWFALVHRDAVEKGIDPNDLTAGTGRITRLCLYKDQTDFLGNPYMPSLSVKRYIFANYHRDWSVFNKNYYDMVKELITYLERRYSFKLVK
ncbi:MAG: hypothetical protein N4A68_02140 [Maledivibacter sp.]|jgi:hypothetical protein|nr:hypothetical protein [Maledivibacter sp.]